MSKCTFSTSPSIKRYLFIYLFEKDKCLQIFQYIILIRLIILFTLIIQLRDDCIMLIVLCWICTNTGINWICDVSIFI